MTEFNTKAQYHFNCLNDKEQNKALSTLLILDNMDIEAAKHILEFCKAALETKAIVKV